MIQGFICQQADKDSKIIATNCQETKNESHSVIEKIG